jgi:hypothetical protein
MLKTKVEFSSPRVSGDEGRLDTATGNDGWREEVRRIAPQNALKVMMVRVSWMPGMVCTFSLTKWPMSVFSST